MHLHEGLQHRRSIWESVIDIQILWNAFERWILRAASAASYFSTLESGAQRALQALAIDHAN